MNRLSRALRFAVTAIGLVAAGRAAMAADLQIFTKPHFTGAEITLFGETPDVTGLQYFHDQAASLVLNGRWEVCTEPNYKGQCVVLAPGRYATLSAPIYKAIGSVRPLGAVIAESERRREEERRALDQARRQDTAPDYGRREPVPREAPRYRERRGAVDLFPNREFDGRPLRFEKDTESLGRYSGRTSSLVVHEGTWQLCTEPRYEGRCRTYGPGRYPSLGGLDDRIASLRQVR